MTLQAARKLVLSILVISATGLAHGQRIRIGDALGKAKSALGKIGTEPWKPGAAITTSIKDTLYGITWLEDEYLHAEEPDTIESFDLKPGYYKASIRSYCLHAGVYGPTKGDGYQVARLKGTKSTLVRNILSRSAEHPEIAQHDVQTLIWGIEAGAKFSSYEPSFQLAVKPMLTEMEIAAMEVNVGQLAGKAVPADLKEMAQTYESLRDKMQSSQIKYDEIEAIAVKTGAPALGFGSKVIDTNVWSYIGDGFYLKASPRSYPRTDIAIYRPAKPEVVHDTKKRISAYSYNGYSVEIVYNDLPGQDQFIVEGHTVPVWKIKGYRLKGPKTGQSLEVKTDQWFYRGSMAEFSALVNNGPVAGSSGPFVDDASATPAWQEIKERYERTKKWIDRYKEAKGYVEEYEDIKNPPDLEEYTNEAAVNENIHEGLKAALNPIDKKGQSDWIRKNLRMTLDMMFNAICQMNGGCSDNETRRPDLPSHPAQPGNTSKQRIGLSPYKAE